LGRRDTRRIIDLSNVTCSQEKAAYTCSYFLQYFWMIGSSRNMPAWVTLHYSSNCSLLMPSFRLMNIRILTGAMEGRVIFPNTSRIGLRMRQEEK
jgi:hypothetical protein